MNASTDSNSPALIIERDGTVAIIQLNAPPMNPLGDAQIRGLQKTIKELGADKAIRAIVIRGARAASDNSKKLSRVNFSVGANLKEQDLAAEAGPAVYVKRRIDLFSQIEACEKPIIAAIEGYCLGGGLELAMACHYRVAEEGAILSLPEIDLGAAPMWSGAGRVLRLVGRARALELLLLGEKIPASKALEFGLVNKMFSASEFEQQVLDLAQTFAEKAPLAMAAIIRVVNYSQDVPLAEALEFEHKEFAPLAESQDIIEGVTALFEKRKPVFKGE